MSRTVQRWSRVYVDGYDMSGYSRSLSPLVCTFDEADLTALSDSVKGYLPARVNMGIGTINANLDNTATSGSHVVLSSAGVPRTVMVAQGMRAEPAQGDPAYVGVFQQSSYQAAEDGGAMVVSIGFDDYAATTRLNYERPWGVLLRPKTLTEDENAGAGVNNGAATAKGGYLMYQVFSGDGTATISIDDSANNSDWLALSGATSGEIDFSTPTAGIVQLATGATVRQYLRWQISLNTATAVTFALAFVRG